MADRDPVHQPSTGKGELVLGAKSWEVPLLPYEKQLIAAIGCSEEEYRWFAAEARRRGVVRPAEYAHIPDARMEVGTIIAVVSLVIGLASTAVSYALTPKPKSFDSASAGDRQRRRGPITAASITGVDRFSPTFGFDTQADLATYGDPIPIIFGRYDDATNTGGITHSPKLVWSRVFSHGTQQSAKLLFVVGEAGVDLGQRPRGIAAPVLQGVFLGNGSLDSIYSEAFAFYWKLHSFGFTRISASNLAFGSRAEEASGDPETNNDIFACPTAISDTDTGFSSAHSLSNNFEFGCYAPIPNGTPFRLPWRVISRPRSKDEDDNFNPLTEDDKDLVQTRERRKITGNDRMDGTGRNYSRRMGIISYRDTEVSESVGKEEVPVTLGKQIRFKISSNNISRDYYNRADNDDVTTDDITSFVNEARVAADDALQVGELFMIRRTVWQVVKRRFAIWTPELEQDQIIRLKCVEILGPDQIGVVANEMLSKAVLNDEGRESTVLHVDPTFYPLMRVAFGLVRNTRACEVTEIGLRSRVYQRLNGLTNFQSLPTSGRLNGADNTRVSISTGTNTSFIRRASAFLVYVRPAGVDENGEEYRWDIIGQPMVIVGNNPTDQYNYLRFKHPDRRQYEFRFVPKNGADMRNTANDTIFWRLSATPKPEEDSSAYALSGNYQTRYGTFAVSSQGQQVQKNNIRYNLEFTYKGSLSQSVSVAGYPTLLTVSTFLPYFDPTHVEAAALERKEWFQNPSNIGIGRNGAFCYELFGNPDSSSFIVERRLTKDVKENLADGRWVTVRYTYYKRPFGEAHWSGLSHTWTIESYGVIQSGGGFVTGNEITIKRTVSTGNPFRNTPEGRLIEVGPVLLVTQTRQSQESGGRAQATLYEILGHAINYENGAQRSAIINLGEGSKTLRVRVASVAVDVTGHRSGQPRIWDLTRTSYTVVRDPGTSTNWITGDTVDKYYTVSAANPFYRADEVGLRLLVNSIEEIQQNTSELSSGKTYESHPQYADVSYYAEVEKSNSNQPEHAITYVNELVSNETIPTYDNMTLCGLSIKAGRNFNSLDQLRMWLPNGTQVKRFHPDDNNNAGPSNLFCDLVYYLLTDTVAGLGKVLRITESSGGDLIGVNDFTKTARFLKTNKLFFNGVIGESINVRQYINEMAPNFLCNFVISDGKFSLVPAVPTDAAGEISPNPVQIKQLFTSGNIIEDTFEVEYLSTEERKPFQAVVRFREERKNQLPQERNVVVRWAQDDEYVPTESYDLTSFCTNREHAELVGRFFISLRRRITHTVRFSTAPYGLDLAPGDYIRVDTQSSPYSSARNGVISAVGAITSVTPLSDGQYNVLYYKPGSDDVEYGTITVSNNAVTDSTFFNTVFTIIDSSTSQNVYLVEQLTLNEDGIVQIVASEFPCDDRLSSLIAQDLMAANRPRFVIES